MIWFCSFGGEFWARSVRESSVISFWQCGSTLVQLPGMVCSACHANDKELQLLTWKVNSCFSLSLPVCVVAGWINRWTAWWFIVVARASSQTRHHPGIQKGDFSPSHAVSRSDLDLFIRLIIGGALHKANYSPLLSRWISIRPISCCRLVWNDAICFWDVCFL